jgi:FAD/FMN-containing dehydrogenase
MLAPRAGSPDTSQTIARESAMSSNVIDDLQANIHGRVVMPGDGEYDEARSVFNAMIDKRPAAVIRVADVSDVIEGVKLARERGLDLAIRGGGHSGPGFGTVDNGIVLDFSERTRVEVDPSTKRAKADAGTTWSMFNRATHEHGLATPGGILGTTGIAGLTLGGGIGYLSRKYGLTCDNLISAEVVTADGSVRTASETENPDLLWALRGGGGNFGVVTSFEYQLHPVDNVHAGIIIYPIEHARTVAEFYREQIKTAPEEMGIFMGFHQGPPVPFLPAEWVGKPVCVIVGMWTGDPAEGPGMWQPYLDVAPVAGSMVGEMPYPALNEAFDELIHKGLQDYWKANFISDLSDGAIDVYTRFGATVPSLQTSVHIYPINGAVQRVAPDATAFAFRHANFAPVIAGFWEDPADNEANIKWVRDFSEALRPFAEAGGYINFMDSDDQGRITDNYGGNYARLAEIKAKYDPDNLFHVNQNIKPA